jgi:hypothetical protein
MSAMRRLLVVLALLALPGSAMAQAPEHEHGGGDIAQARHAHGATRPPDPVAGGAISVQPTEGFASALRTVRISLASGAGAVDLAFPRRFSQRASNGRAFMRGRPLGGHLGAADRSVDLDVSGLPAGTYRVPVRRGGALLGTAEFRLYAQRKEGREEEEGEKQAGPFGRLGRVPVDSSGDDSEESETFIVADPDTPARFASYGNDIELPPAGTGGLNVTNDGGANWAHVTFPMQFDIKGSLLDELENPSGDPILAADTQGNIWAGGLSTCTTLGTASHIFVNRLAGPSGTTPLSKNVAIPFLHGGGGVCNPLTEIIQDKPQMTIDNTSSSTTFGRIYVTWDDPDPSGAVNEVVSYCDSRPTVTNCDSADHWSDPAVITDTPGSYITSDPAVGPDGKVYVAWWDYSARNAIGIDVCDPVAHSGHCDAAADWGTDRIVASLSTHSGAPVPFACPTLAQPGGRAAPVPSLAVDHSSGRIYVAWSDLATTGSTRCFVKFDGEGSPPDPTQDTFKSYVASAPDYATLTTDPATPSQVRGTNIIGDAGDHWFPWVAVDQSTGQAWVDLYSTRDDATRKTARFYARAVVPGSGTRVSYGPLTPVSDDATDYSDKPCCQFDNDYGDYTGLDAASGSVFAVWTHRLLGGDGDVFVNVLAPPVAPTETPVDDAILPPPPPPPPPATTGATPIPPPPRPPAGPDRTKPVLKLTFAKTADRRGRYRLSLKATGEAAAGRATLRLAKKRGRRLASGLLATSGSKPLKLVLKLKPKDLRTLKRRHRLRVKLTISLEDIAGNTARTSKTFTLRLRK